VLPGAGCGVRRGRFPTRGTDLHADGDRAADAYAEGGIRRGHPHADANAHAEPDDIAFANGIAHAGANADWADAGAGANGTADANAEGGGCKLRGVAGKTPAAQPDDWERALRGVDFPSSKVAIVRDVRENGGIDREVLTLLDGLPKDEYETLDELQAALRELYVAGGYDAAALPL
jgi:hypothetical protein